MLSCVNGNSLAKLETDITSSLSNLCNERVSGVSAAAIARVPLSG